MIKKVTINMASGKVFSCGMKETAIDNFKNAIITTSHFVNVSKFLPNNESRNKTTLWIMPSAVETILIENVSNIAVAKDTTILDKPA